MRYLAERFELFDRLTQLRGACPQFVEEAGILDRDDRLIGEGLQHGDLPFGAFGPSAADSDRSTGAIGAGTATTLQAACPSQGATDIGSADIRYVATPGVRMARPRLRGRRHRVLRWITSSPSGLTLSQPRA